MRAAPLADRLPHRAVVLIDTNAFIEHPDDPDERRILNNEAAPVEDRRALVLARREAILGFYACWTSLIEAWPGCLAVTEAQLDLELSGWRRINGDASRYARKLRLPRPPRGDLVRAHDIRATRAAKNRLIEALGRGSVINPILRARAKGLRARLRAELFDKPLWRKAAQSEGVSAVDLDLLQNALAATQLGQVSLVTEDRGLRRLAQSILNGIANAPIEGVDGARLELLGWQRQGDAIWTCE